VGYTLELLGSFGPVRIETLGTALPARTLIGVQALAAPECLIEIEAVAVV